MKHIVCSVLAAAMVLFAPPGTAQEPPAPAAPPLTSQDAGAWLDCLLPYLLKKNDLASAVVVVVKDGEVLLAKGYGYADVAAKKPVDPATTLFRPGSVSKTFMWTAVMQLVEQGKINLDLDVNAYLDFTIPPREGQPITMRQLMTHTPGFEEIAKNLFTRDAKMVDNGAWLKTWVPERVFAPGTVSAYSNYGAALAGYIVQRVSGQPFDDYIEQHIYQPLGMRHATFRQPLPANLQADMALGYVRASQPARPFEFVVPPPAGSMSVSGTDMARYMIAHLQDGRYGEQRILRAETAQQMHRTEHYSVPGLLPMALGFYRNDRNGQTMIGHGGTTELFHSDMALMLKQNVGIFLSVSGGANGGGIGRLVINGMLDRYFPAAPDKRPALATARTHGAFLAGRYLSSRVPVSNFLSILNLPSQMTVSVDAEGLLVTPAFKDLAGQPRRWREVAPFIWRDVNGGSRLSAVMQNGKVRWLATDESAPIMAFLPVPAWQSAAWNLPLFYFSFAVLLASVALWPIGALINRSYGEPSALMPPARRYFRWSRIAALLHLLFYAGWFWILQQMDDSIANMNDGLDGTIRIVQLIGVFALLGIVPMLANVGHAWRENGGWWRKLNSLVLVVAGFATLWFAFSLHLLNLHLNY